MNDVINRKKCGVCHIYMTSCREALMSHPMHSPHAQAIHDNYWGRKDPFVLPPLIIPRYEATHAPIRASSPQFTLAQSHLA